MKNRNGKWKYVTACISIVLSASLLVSCVSGGNQHLTSNQYALATAVYPQMSAYPDESSYISSDGNFDSDGFDKSYDAWVNDKQAQLTQSEGYKDGVEQFAYKNLITFLSGSNGQNRAYSPLNIYVALGMLAEITDGESRQQILDVLSVDSIDHLREKVKAIWHANYSNDGATTSILANSLWLNQDIRFKQATLDSLANSYYASSYQGEMGSEELNKALQQWLNEQTGGLLEEQASNVQLDAETILALASTIYYQAKWDDEFLDTETTEDVFKSADGDIACDFMHQSDSKNYYWADHFSAVAQGLRDSGSMWFILPDEDTDIDTLLQDSQLTEFLTANGDWENSKYLTVNLSIPKFDISAQFDLSDKLKSLGVTDVFSSEKSNFAPLTDDVEKVYVSSADHAVRVKIDEEGCSAAAYTVMQMAGAAMPPEEQVDFNLNRPFIFVLTGTDGSPLFAGVVNQPVEG